MTDAHPIPPYATPAPAKGGLGTEHLPAVERWGQILAAALLLASVFTGNARSQVGALCGAGLSLFNLRLVAALGQWARRGTGDEARRRISLMVGLFQLKLGLLGALIYLTLRYLPAAPLWLLLGLSLLPLSILARAIEFRGERLKKNHG